MIAHNGSHNHPTPNSVSATRKGLTNLTQFLKLNPKLSTSVQRILESEKKSRRGRITYVKKQRGDKTVTKTKEELQISKNVKGNIYTAKMSYLRAI